MRFFLQDSCKRTVHGIQLHMLRCIYILRHPDKKQNAIEIFISFSHVSLDDFRFTLPVLSYVLLVLLIPPIFFPVILFTYPLPMNCSFSAIYTLFRALSLSLPNSSYFFSYLSLSRSLSPTNRLPISRFSTLSPYTPYDEIEQH